MYAPLLAKLWFLCAYTEALEAPDLMYVHVAGGPFTILHVQASPFPYGGRVSVTDFQGRFTARAALPVPLSVSRTAVTGLARTFRGMRSHWLHVPLGLASVALDLMTHITVSDKSLC